MKKLGMTAVSVAVLAACAPPQQAMNSDPNAEIVCTKEARVDSHIKEESCVRVVKGGYDEFPGADDPFRKNPQASDRSARVPDTSLPPPGTAEGSCGAVTDD